MDFIYYIIRKKDNVILDGAADMVNAINMAQKQKDIAPQEIIESETKPEMVAEIIE